MKELSIKSSVPRWFQENCRTPFINKFVDQKEVHCVRYFLKNLSQTGISNALASSSKSDTWQPCGQQATQMYKLETTAHKIAFKKISRNMNSGQNVCEGENTVQLWVLLTLILLTWTKWWAPASASKWRMGFNSAFKGLNPVQNLHKSSYFCMIHLCTFLGFFLSGVPSKKCVKYSSFLQLKANQQNPLTAGPS